MNINDGKWHLDKRVHVAMIFAILMQTVTAVWWARGMQDDVDAAAATMEVQSRRLEELQVRLAAQEIKNGRIESQLANIDRTQQSILSKVDAIHSEMVKR